MDLVLIVRDALASSLVGNMAMAIGARQAGKDVAVLFTGEALAAMARGSFAWPRELAGQEMRLTLAANGAAAGLPVVGRGEGRQFDARGYGRAGAGCRCCAVRLSHVGAASWSDRPAAGRSQGAGRGGGARPAGKRKDGCRNPVGGAK